MPEIESVQDNQMAARPRYSKEDGRPGIGSYVGTVALVGLGVLLIEEELLAGVALGVAAMAFPSLVPKIGTAMRPLLRSAVRVGYGVAARTRETVAEMSEQFQDVVAEVRAEHEPEGTDGRQGEASPVTTASEPTPGDASGPAAERESGRTKRTTRSGTAAAPTEGGSPEAGD
ncbi:MAG: hypothetical protein QOJ99_4135 [Bryobacterales bacterium]|jgi:hypothetical protein|nr:hypothetical protein [Bryobacterales bacterium]